MTIILAVASATYCWSTLGPFDPPPRITWQSALPAERNGDAIPCAKMPRYESSCIDEMHASIEICKSLDVPPALLQKGARPPALLQMAPPSHERAVFVAASQPGQPLPVAQLHDEAAPPPLPEVQLLEEAAPLGHNGLVPILHQSRDEPWTRGTDRYHRQRLARLPFMAR